MSKMKKMMESCGSSNCALWSALAIIVIVLAVGGPMLVERQVGKAFSDNPELLADAIKKNPLAFMEAVKEAAGLAQEQESKNRAQKEEREMEDKFDNPLVPVIRKDENIRGNPDAPITLVEYSDFECPFCSRAFNTVEELRSKYGSKLRFIYKHLPLSFHPNAMDAARYHEAIRIQNGKKAWEFHDELLKNLPKVKTGAKYFRSLAKKLGVNMKKLSADVKSDAVEKRIQEDMKEAEKFGFRGTPGFVINGIPVKGAYPASHFHQIVGKLKEKGKINL